MSASQFDVLNDKINTVIAALAGKNGTNDKLSHIATLVGGREALDAQAATVQAIVRKELSSIDIQGAVREAIGSLNVSGVDETALANAVVANIASKLGQ